MEKIEQEENLFESDEEDEEDRPKLTAKTGFRIRDLIKEGVVLDLQDVDGDNKNPNFYIDDDVSKYFNPECVECSDSDSYSEREEEVVEEENDAHLSPFEKLAAQMTDITNDAGVLKKVLKAGTVAIPESALVTMHYNAFFEYGDEPFDSSRLRNKPIIFRLKDGGVVRGLQNAVASMCLGEVSQFLLSYNYAYGKMGCPPRIPPQSTILYEVEVLDFTDYSVSIDDSKLTEEELEEMGFEKLMSAIKSEHILGNDLFKKNNVHRAAARYRKASRLLENLKMENDEQELQYKKMVVKVSSNLALCMLRMNNPVHAQTQCNKVLEIEPKNVKALFRKGKAKLMLDDFEMARNYLVRAKNLSPSSIDIVNALVELDERMKDYARKEKAFCMSIFTSASSTSTSIPRAPSSVATCGSENQISEISEAVKRLDTASVLRKANEHSQPDDPDAFGVTAKFAFMVREKLERFRDDDRESELRFPGKCSVEEIAYIGSVAYIHGLKVTHDHNGLMKITK